MRPTEGGGPRRPPLTAPAIAPRHRPPAPHIAECGPRAPLVGGTTTLSTDIHVPEAGAGVRRI
ncbi:hypothetical protein [Streptomyces sp. YIM 130001]|uniref:hypothetical protein n=1 Tax=Streptomyces sp. YIM 130001 TaxID=2259644 RepID=UPI0013C46769|nr:hypothetical protein [Streptomyces sp. YIM 130001]